MPFLRKMASFVRRLTVREPSGWIPQAHIADSGEIVTDQTVLALSSVWGCVNLLSGTVSSLPVEVFQKSGSVNIPVSEHPMRRLLDESPNYDQTSVDFWDFVSVSLELWGNAYGHLQFNGSEIVSINPINPSAVSVRRLENGDLEYRWTADGNSFVETDKRVLHIRGFGGDAIGGLSTLQYGRNVFGLGRAIDGASSATFKNGLRPSGALVFKDWLTPENRQLAEDVLSGKFSGAVNTGRPMILEGGTTWQAFALNPEDAQMLQSRRFSVEDICRYFGVPPHMIGHTEKNTSFGAGLEQQTLAFQKFTLRRRLRRIEKAVGKQLLSDADRAKGLRVRFNLEELLSGDSSSRANYYQTALSSGWMTINEVRQKENLPPVEGGEVPRMQMQNVPITEAGNDEQAQ